MNKIAKALTIAGSDSGGGAGILADIKTFQELEVFGMSAITAITAQNTLGVQGVYPLSVEAVQQQIKSIGEDIGTDALKTGMLFSSEIIQVVAEQIKHYQWRNVVVDPVMIAKGGASLLQREAIEALKKDLLPLATVITPNIPEAELLTGITIKRLADRQKAAQYLWDLGVAHVVIKGGHGEGELVDLLFDGKEFTEYRSERIQTKNTHGTGCTFAAAVTAELAKGREVKEAVQVAKDFIQAAVENQIAVGHGHGPTNHWAYRREKMKKHR